MMDLGLARRIAEDWRDTDEAPGEVIRALADRLDLIDSRAQQIRGGLKPYARPVEIVDYLLAEPEA